MSNVRQYPFGFAEKMQVLTYGFSVRTGKIVEATALMEKLGFIFATERVGPRLIERNFNSANQPGILLKLIEDKSVYSGIIRTDETSRLILNIEIPVGQTIEDVVVEVDTWLQHARVGRLISNLSGSAQIGLEIRVPELVRFVIELRAVVYP